MMIINKILSEIKKHKNIFLTTHKNIDIDGLGAILGFYDYCKSIKKNVYIIVEDEMYDDTIYKSSYEMNIYFTKYNDIENKIDSDALLVILDTNNEKLIQNEKLLSINDKIIIDHHINTKKNNDYLIEYIDITYSSTSEMVFNLLNKVNFIVNERVATVMLSGILVDTNNFSIKTTANTYMNCSLLIKSGANNDEAHNIIKDSIYEHKEMNQELEKMEVYKKKYGIVCVDSKFVSKTILSKISDIMITFENIEVAFTIGMVNDKIVGISARSISNIDVENIMKQLGGGGHKNNAAAQVENMSIYKVKEKLIELIGGLL